MYLVDVRIWMAVKKVVDGAIDITASNLASDRRHTKGTHIAGITYDNQSINGKIDALYCSRQERSSGLRGNYHNRDSLAPKEM